MTEPTRPTRAEILAEPPGRRLDGWVAEYVTKWAPSGMTLDMAGTPFPESLPEYSRDIAAAWGVVEYLTGFDYVKIHVMASHYHGDHCSVIAAHPSQREDGCPVAGDTLAIWGESAAHAISRAALLSVLEGGAP